MPHIYAGKYQCITLRVCYLISCQLIMRYLGEISRKREKRMCISYLDGMSVDSILSEKSMCISYSLNGVSVGYSLVR